MHWFSFSKSNLQKEIQETPESSLDADLVSDDKSKAKFPNLVSTVESVLSLDADSDKSPSSEKQWALLPTIWYLDRYFFLKYSSFFMDIELFVTLEKWQKTLDWIDVLLKQPSLHPLAQLHLSHFRDFCLEQIHLKVSYGQYYTRS